MGRDNRQFIRHPVKVPIEVSTMRTSPGRTHEGVNVSHGGIAFLVDEEMYEGQTVSLRMPTVSPPFEANARVAWCRTEGVKYCVGVAFIDASDALKARMVEQACAIEAYRIDAMKKGRRLTAAQAAEEWVRKHGDAFRRISEQNTP
ncbi:MAG: PilZ domain-containing protein [Gemmatimonadota bacterium]